MKKMWFLDKTKYFIILSSLIVLAALIVGLFSKGLNLGIDFTGGSLLTIDFGAQYDQQTVENALSENGINPATAQIVSAEGGTQAVIRMQVVSEDTDIASLRNNIVVSIQKTYPGAEAEDIESVGGVTSREIVANAFYSVLIAAGVMMIYIWIRFALFSGLAGVAALIHDVLIMTAFMSITRTQINSSYIAACLTIVGYSINDTIVVFDRIRENNRVLGSRGLTRAEIADMSIRETLPRTINTSMTTLVTILAVYIFGVTSIREFALPIIIGLLSGTYSSIFIASPIWIALEDWQDRRTHKKMGAKPAGQKA
jgi:preprotein translocase subunit SecF